MNHAVFLDRDGVLNVDYGYIFDESRLQPIPGAREAVRRIHDAGYLAIVVTNQSGIARGFATEDQYFHFELDYRNWFEELIDDIYMCPHHPTEGLPLYRIECDCRKPANGLIERAIAEWQIERTGSFLVGDKASDIEAAELSGIPGHLFPGGNLDAFISPLLEIHRSNQGVHLTSEER